MKKRRILVLIAAPFILVLGYALYATVFDKILSTTAHAHDQEALVAEYKRLSFPATFNAPATKYVPYEFGSDHPSSYILIFNTKLDPEAATSVTRSVLESAGYTVPPAPADPPAATSFMESKAPFLAIAVGKQLPDQSGAQVTLVLQTPYNPSN